MGSIDKPTLVYPLAVSFNERDTLGYTASYTSGRDQQKKNFCNEIVKNPLNNKGTLALSKRPGVTINASTFGAISGQVAMNIIDNFGANIGDSTPLVFSYGTVGGSAQLATVSNGSTTTTIASTSALAGYIPIYVDKTNISNVENIVVQLKSTVTPPLVAQKVYYSVSIGAWTEIVDADFVAIRHRGKMEHLDGYAFIMSDDNRVWNSDLNSLTSWGAASFVTKTVSADRGNGLIKYKNQILAFGDETVEPFFNAGNATGSPLTRIPHLSDKIGLHAGSSLTLGGRVVNYYAIVQNRLYFIGRRGGGINSVGLFSYDGSRYEKVSNSYMDKILSQAVNTGVSSVFPIGFNGQEGIAIEFTPGTTSIWLMFFPDWKDWFIWDSTVFRPVNNGTFFLAAGTANQGRIYNFAASNTYQDNSVSFSAETAFKLPIPGHHLKRMPSWGVEADTDTSANSLTVRYSDDDSSSYAAFGTIDLTQQKKMNYIGGAFRERHIQLVSNNARPVRLHNFLANIK